MPGGLLYRMEIMLSNEYNGHYTPSRYLARYKRPDFDMVDSRFPICGGVCRITLGKNLGACLTSVVNRRADIVARRCDGNCGD